MSCYLHLEKVQRPYQYVGHEENAYRKPWDASRVRLCLAFPDAYEIGMSNIGMQILYHVVNEEPRWLADRVYAPLVDMGQLLRETGQKLLGRESGRPLTDFDLVGFTLQYELCYTNVLYMLELGGVPIKAADRQEGDPLVLGGGPCAFNPEPVADFFDLFLIGEGEEGIVDICRELEACRATGLSRRATLSRLGKIPGVYVPSLYEPLYDENGRFLELKRGPEAPRWVERRIVKDLDRVPYPKRPVMPAIQPVHERIAVEIQRGCTRACRFCQAGYVYRPRRERNPNTVLDIIDESVRATGIQDIGLLSLSSADYGNLHPLMSEILTRYKSDRLSIALPSTRLEALREDYLEVLREQRRSGFTIAPEAGSQRLRNVINKNFTEEEVIRTARMLFSAGWQKVKMYFMIGQPTETDDDVRAIAELANTVYEKVSDIPGRKQITVSVSNFVPKPHTPFQWHAQISHEEIMRKQRLVKESIRYPRDIGFRCHGADLSFAEGIIARGDRRVALLIERAYRLGAVFDCWNDLFDISIWKRAIDEIKDEIGIDLAAEGLRERSLDERLPWHRIYCGLHPKFFKNEYTKAVYGLATEDCSFSACHECGLCHEKSGVKPIVHGKVEIERKELAGATTESIAEEATYRFQYAKDGPGIFISVLDLQKLLVRAFTRAGIKVAHDNRMRARPKLSMGPALALGVSSQCELFDITLETDLDTDEILARTNAYLPDHVRLLTGTRFADKAPPLSQAVTALSFRVHMSELGGLSAREIDDKIATILAAETYLMERERKSRTGATKRSVIDLKQCLRGFARQGEYVYFSLEAPFGQAVSPYLVLEALVGSEAVQERLIPVEKTGFFT